MAYAVPTWDATPVWANYWVTDTVNVPTWPDGATVGDLAVAFVRMTGGSGEITVPAGWTIVGSSLTYGSSIVAAYQRTIVAGDTSGAPPTFTRSGATSASVALRLFHGTTGAKAGASAGFLALSPSWTVPSLTMPVAHCLLAGVAFSDAFTTPSSWSVATVEATTMGGKVGSVASFTSDIAASGATGTSTITWPSNTGGQVLVVAVQGITTASRFLVDETGAAVAAIEWDGTTTTSFPAGQVPVVSLLSAPADLETAAAALGLAGQRLVIPDAYDDVASLRRRMADAAEWLRLSSVALARAGAHYTWPH